MKNKKGFTLAEILIVIALIGIIMLLVVPNITKTLNEGKKKAFATQVQKMLTVAEDTYAEGLADGTISLTRPYMIYCDSESRSIVPEGCLPLDTSGEKLKYIVAISQGRTAFLGVSNKDFCYSKVASGYYNEITTKIDKNQIMIGGHLTCTSSMCQCVGGTVEGEPLPIENGFVYWGETTSNRVDHGGTTTVNVQALLNASPGGVVLDYSELEEDSVFVRSTVENGQITKHEACLRNFVNNNVLCLGNDYYAENDSATETKLVQDITSTLGVSGVSCSKETGESQTLGAVHNVACTFEFADGYVDYKIIVNEKSVSAGYEGGCHSYKAAYTDIYGAEYAAMSSPC